MSRKKVQEWLFEIKSSLSCFYCGKRHPAIIDFHHRDPKNKYKDISSIQGKDRIMEEIKKCDPICANCHRKLHYGEVLCPIKTS